MEVQLIHYSSELQLADLMTKALSRSRIEFLKLKLGMSKPNLKEEC